MGRALHHIWLGIFEAETEGEERRGDEVGPKNLERREREDGDSGVVLEGEANEEQDDLGDVGDQKVEEELEFRELVMTLSIRSVCLIRYVPFECCQRAFFPLQWR